MKTPLVISSATGKNHVVAVKVTLAHNMTIISHLLIQNQLIIADNNMIAYIDGTLTCLHTEGNRISHGLEI